MLVVRVSLYQYAICNSRIINCRCYWHGEELRFHKLEKTFWSPYVESPIDEEEQISTESLNALLSYFTETFGESDLVIMLPDWHKNREYINIILALLLQSDPNLARLPIHIYAHSDKFLHSLNEDQKHFVEKLIEQKRFTLNFASIFSSFDSLAEDSEYRRTHEKNPDYDQAPFWVRLDDLREDICVNLIKYALTVEIQKLLNSHKCYGGMIDGWFSDRTKQAVRRFQKLHDLEEGVLNRQTWMLLKKGT